MARDFELSDAVAHVNLCGFGKAVIQAALSGQADELVLVNCCDVMRRVYEVVKEANACRFVHMLDLPHGCGPCQIEAFARSLRDLRDAWQAYSGHVFDMRCCRDAFSLRPVADEPYVGVLGVRVGRELQEMMETAFDLPVLNLSCTGNRRLAPDAGLFDDDEEAFFLAYARSLLAQIPCRRMGDFAGRRALFEGPALRGIVYHTMKFCDFYGPEFAEMEKACQVPILKIESDFTLQSAEQLRMRLEASAESTGFCGKGSSVAAQDGHASQTGAYVADIDSGSTSTDVVVLDQRGEIAAPAIVHGLNKSVAAKISTLVRRVGGKEAYMMTGGVAQNAGVVRAIEEKLGCRLFISGLSQLCGALGAALYALDGYEG